MTASKTKPKSASAVAQPQLALSVQYAIKDDDLPTRPQVRKWVKAALERDAEITVRFVDTEEGQALNHDYRRKNYATNVLSFVYADAPVTGDLVICAPVVMREANEQKKTPQAHYAHLVIHGVLHLQGYDHEKARDAKVMEARETELITRLGYTDPYA